MNRAVLKSPLLDCLLIFLLTAALVKPLFKVKYLDKWASIESTFVSDGRFLRDHWPHPLWQPLWYCGTRFDYVYPPALRYGAAVITKIYPPVLPVRAYHIYIAFFYCAGIAGAYLLTRVAGGSRAWAWVVAAATALLSPSFLFMPEIRKDAWLLVPHRLGSLVRYGEGPHISALSLLPIALAVSWLALVKRSNFYVALAGIFCALVTSNNFYGGVAMAALFPIVVWSLWLAHQDRSMLFRAAAIPALAYGLTAFWLVPSYFRLTSDNMKYVSDPGNRWSAWVLLAFTVAYVLLSEKWGRGRPERAWRVFVYGAVMFFVVNVVGNRFLNFRVVGEPGRWIPELDWVLILLAAEGLRWLWARGRLGQIAAVAVAALCFSFSLQYVMRAWHIYIRDDYTQRVEYRMADWMAKNLPGQRALATGSVRFWYDAWHDLPQVGGGSEQGILNGALMGPQWVMMLSEKADPVVLWLTAFGADAVIVHDKNSQENYKDFQFPYKFKGVLPVLYDSGQGDVIYRIPRRYPGLGRVVEMARISALKIPDDPNDLESVRAYVDTIEKGPDAPVEWQWEGTDAARLRANVAAGQAVLAQVSYDPAWHAYSGTMPLPVHKDLYGFMLLDAPPGLHDIRLVFELPFENKVGRVLTALTLLATFALLATGRREARS